MELIGVDVEVVIDGGGVNISAGDVGAGGL